MNNTYPLVTIAIPIYGVEKHIKACAESIFEQTYSNIEFLFINDCTKDNSIEVLNCVLNNYSHRKAQVRIVNHTHNRGLSAARNTAIELANGEFIFHVDSDDYIEKNAIEILVNEAINNKADLVVANYIIHLEDKRNIFVKYLDISKSKEEIMIDSLNDKSSHSVWGILIKKDIYINNKIKAVEGVNIGEDWQVAPLLLYYAKKIIYTNNIIYHYILSRPGSYTIDAAKSINKKKKSILQFVKTINHLIEIFSNKEIIYLDILYNKKAVLVQDAMIYCCKDKDKENFKEMVYELNKIPKKNIKVIGKSNTFFMLLKKNYYCFKVLLSFT